MEFDAFTVVAQLVNFAVLVAALRLVLYKRVVAAIDQRGEALEARRLEAEAARERADDEARQLREARAELDERSHQLMVQARADAAEERSKLLEGARDEVEAVRESWRAELEQERAAVHRSLQAGLASALGEALDRIIVDLADQRLGAVVARQLADRLVTAESLGLEAPSTQTGAPRLEIEVTSAPALDSATKQLLREVLATCITQPHSVQFGVDPDLLLGLRLRLGEREVQWSASDHLHRIAADIDAELAARADGLAPSEPQVKP